MLVSMALLMVLKVCCRLSSCPLLEITWV